MRIRRVLPLLVLSLALAHPARSETGDESRAERALRSLRIGGFADVTYFDADDEAGADSGFEQGQLVVHLSSSLTPKVSFFSELSLTARDSDYSSAVERLFVRFDRSDRLKFSLGKYHTPINWWNTAFHHGLWLQTTIERPAMTRFGGKFIPVHFVGALVEGALPAGGWNLNYTAGVGNGRSSDVVGAGDGGDDNDNRAPLVSLFVRPDRLYSLRVGGSYYRDRITLADGSEYRESIASAHVVWVGETPEVIAEFSQETHRGLATGEKHRNDAFYVQVAYRLPQWKQRLKPYARFEKIDVAEADPVLADLSDLERALIGLRVDAADYVAVKGEVWEDRPPGGRDIRAIALQVSFAF